MKLSLNWLQDFVDLKVKDPQEIARRLTAGVAEVDDVTVQGALLQHCVVGKVLDVQKHPNADRLSLTRVMTDKGEKQIVCGGTNLRPGMRVAVAHTGATVRWHGTEMVTLEKTKIRNVESEGMICAAEELDLAGLFPEATDKHIIDLGDGDEGVGQPLKEYLGQDDVVIHIDNHAITHRADLFSHLGFAREFVALGLATWRRKDVRSARLSLPTKAPPFKVHVENKQLVPRYNAVLLEISGLGQTPQWMKKRLEATGWRSISLPIDITNYVMMETGMPHHAFDAADFTGDIHIRGAKKGEKIVTLDGEERKLLEGALVISDDTGIFDLFGIMGGLRSSTKDSTQKIWLQAAIPDPSSIRRTVIGMGHRTDAATVYEKGVPKIMSEIGLHRAIELFLELVPGAKIASKQISWGDDGKASPIDLDLAYAKRMLGIDVPQKQLGKIFADLEFTVKKGKSKGRLSVTPPMHRLGDIRAKHDLVEEIGRVHGYDSIAATAPMAETAPPARDARRHILRQTLKDHGYAELVPLSLVGPSLLQMCGLDPKDAYEVESPLGEELSLLHTSTVPSLLAHAERNLLHGGKTLRTFHAANVFRKSSGETAEMALLRADLAGASADGSLLDEPLLQLKRDVSALADALGYELDTPAAGTPPSMAHPGRFGELLLRVRGKADEASEPSRRIGQIFEVHPDTRAKFSLPHRAAVAVIDMTALLALPLKTTLGRAVPLFPSIVYDVTLPLSHRREAGELLRRLRGANPLLESVEVADLYAGAKLPKGEYTLTLRLTYRAPDRTLTEAEAKKAHDAILKQADSTAHA